MAFKVSVDDSAVYPVIQLLDKSTGTYAEIYCYGAMLNKFAIVHEKIEINVVEGYESVDDARMHLKPGFKSAKLSPFVCRIKNAAYKFGKAEHQLSKYVVNGSALHGLVFDQVFLIKETKADDNSATVVLEYVYDKPDEGFPFTYRMEIEYSLHKDNSLTLKTTVTNIDEQLMPVTDGWHPYFTFNCPIDECQLEFQSLDILEFTPDLIPTGKAHPYQEFGSVKTIGSQMFDNCFTLDMQECQPLAVFRDPLKLLQVEIHPDNSYPFLQIFTPPHRTSIAIENLSAPPDAFNNANNLHVLEPGETTSFATKYIIRKL